MLIRTSVCEDITKEACYTSTCTYSKAPIGSYIVKDLRLSVSVYTSYCIEKVTKYILYEKVGGI